MLLQTQTTCFQGRWKRVPTGRESFGRESCGGRKTSYYVVYFQQHRFLCCTLRSCGPPSGIGIRGRPLELGHSHSHVFLSAGCRSCASAQSERPSPPMPFCSGTSWVICPREPSHQTVTFCQRAGRLCRLRCSLCAAFMCFKKLC